MSALAWKSLVPGAKDLSSIWTIGIVGALLSLFSGWLERYADFMLLLGGLLVPVGGVLLARFFLLRRPVAVPDLYAEDGPASRHGGFAIPGRDGRVGSRAARKGARQIKTKGPFRFGRKGLGGTDCQTKTCR